MSGRGGAAEAALVLFSGGQDSTTCLDWALDRFGHTETVGFDYGQRHRVELDTRPRVIQAIREAFPAWAARLGGDHVIDLSVLGRVSDTALTREVDIKMSEQGLPTTFVPGRNLAFLTFAAAVAYRRGAKHLVTGVCETDYSGYPDCRDNTMKAMQLALNLGMEAHFLIHTPLMWIDKAATWDMAEELGGGPLVRIVKDETHTCYLGNRESRHPWGWGCGTCPACDLRANGWLRYVSSKGTKEDANAYKPNRRRSR